jgi:hypothetical protein
MGAHVVEREERGEKKKRASGMYCKKGQEPKIIPRKLGGAEEKQGGYQEEKPPANLEGVSIISSEDPKDPAQ